MEKRKCPYCGEDLDKKNAMYTLIWCKDEDELRDVSELKARLEVYKISSETRKQERFDRLWFHYGWDEVSMEFSDSEMILKAEELNDIIDFIKNPDASMFVNRTAKEFNSLIAAPAKESQVRQILPNLERKVEKKEQGKVYFYNKKNKQDDLDDLQGEISIGVESNVVAKVRRVCHHCHDLLPDDVYELPMVKVYIMAMPGSGKSSMLYSLYLNQEKFLEKNQHKMKWSYIQDMTIDGYFKKFYENAQKYKEEKNTFVTPVKFIPPLLLRVDYKKDDEKIESFVVALFDNGGEVFVENQQQNVQSLNERIKGMDAVVCILDGDNSKLNQNRYSVKLNTEDLELIRENSEILSSVLQEEIEENSTMEEVTLEEIMEAYGVRLSKAVEHNIEDLQSEKIVLRDISPTIINTLEHRLGNSDEMNAVIKDQYFALVISKIDLLANSQMIKAKDKGLFFDRGTINYFSEEERQRKLERDRKMREWKKKGILLEYNLKNFREVNYHFVAAHMDNRRGIQPIRIEEPLVGIVEDFIRRKG